MPLAGVRRGREPSVATPNPPPHASAQQRLLQNRWPEPHGWRKPIRAEVQEWGLEPLLRQGRLRAPPNPVRLAVPGQQPVSAALPHRCVARAGSAQQRLQWQRDGSQQVAWGWCPSCWQLWAATAQAASRTAPPLQHRTLGRQEKEHPHFEPRRWRRPAVCEMGLGHAGLEQKEGLSPGSHVPVCSALPCLSRVCRRGWEEQQG